MKMKTTNSRLVITGMGAVTPIGIGVENYCVKKNKSEISTRKFTLTYSNNFTLRHSAVSAHDTFLSVTVTVP